MNRHLYVNKFSIIIGLLIFLNLNGFYLNLGIKFDDISFVANMLFSIMVYCNYFRHGNNERSNFGYIIPVVCLLALFTGLMAQYTYSQPFWLGFRTQRHWIGCYFVFGAIYKLIINGRIDKSNIINVLSSMIFIYTALGIAQYLLYGNVELLDVLMRDRTGNVRLYLNYYFQIILLCIFTDSLLEKIEINKLIYIGMILFMIIAVTQGRMIIVTVLAGILFSYFVKKQTASKKFFISIAIIIALFYLAQTQIGQLLIDTIMGTNTDSVEVRDSGREFYLSILTKDPLNFLFGCGYPHSEWLPAQQYVGVSEGYLTADNGLLGKAINYGFLGCFIWVILCIMILKKGYRIYKATGKVTYLMFVLIDFLGCITLEPMFFYPTLAYPILLILLECDYREIETNYYLEGANL